MEISLSTAYLGPIQYFTKFLMGEVVIEKHESYSKQSYRNRCRIVAANGIENLTIPVIKPNGNNTLVKDVLIDNSRKWQQQHWRTFVAAYNKTPFFEYYADDFALLYEKEVGFLVDFNDALLKLVLSSINIEASYSYSKTYNKEIQNDFRELIHPKVMNSDTAFKNVEYFQVFKSRHGFVPNLSIVDLLFNCGPESILVLNASLNF